MPPLVCILYTCHPQNSIPTQTSVLCLVPLVISTLLIQRVFPICSLDTSSPFSLRYSLICCPIQNHIHHNLFQLASRRRIFQADRRHSFSYRQYYSELVVQIKIDQRKVLRHQDHRQIQTNGGKNLWRRHGVDKYILTCYSLNNHPINAFGIFWTCGHSPTQSTSNEGIFNKRLMFRGLKQF